MWISCKSCAERWFEMKQKCSKVFKERWAADCLKDAKVDYAKDISSGIFLRDCASKCFSHTKVD